MQPAPHLAGERNSMTGAANALQMLATCAMRSLKQWVLACSRTLSTANLLASGDRAETAKFHAMLRHVMSELIWSVAMAAAVARASLVAVLTHCSPIAPNL